MPGSAAEFRGDGPRVVEIKSIGERAWQALKEGEASLAHLVQVQAQLACTGYQTGDLACLVGNRLFEVFPVARHEKLIAQIARLVTEFWDMVKADTPPTIDESDSTAHTLYKLHPNDSGESIEANAEVLDAVRRLREMKDSIKGMEADAQLLENRIKAAMGNATFARGPGFTVTWKTQERKGYEVKPTTFRQMRINMKEHTDGK